METFWLHGYEATSVQDLVKSTGINRASMYDTFGSKHELFVEALNAYSLESAERVRQILGSDKGSPLDNLRRYFALAEEMLYSKKICAGCLLTNTAIELAPHDPEIAALLKATFEARLKAFRDVLQRAMDAGEIAPDAKLDQLAAYLLSTMQGAVASAKAGIPRKRCHTTFAIALTAIPTKQG